MKNIRKKRGFTILEVILVLTLLLSAVSLTLMYYQSAQNRADVMGQTESFASYLRLSQSNAEVGLNGSAHGIRLASDSYTIFVGNAYSAIDPNNFVIDLPPSVVIQNINLNGGGNDVIFDAGSGETMNYGTLQFSSTRSADVKTVTILSSGLINY